MIFVSHLVVCYGWFQLLIVVVAVVVVALVDAAIINEILPIETGNLSGTFLHVHHMYK